MSERGLADPTPDPDADEVEKFFAELPTIVPRLRNLARGTAIAFLAAVVMFGLVSHRTEVNQSVIEDSARTDRISAFRQCKDVNDNARKLNELIQTIIDRIKTADMPKAEKVKAVAQYNAVRQTLPVCKKP